MGETESVEKPSGWNEITGLPLDKAMMLDELAHGFVTLRSLGWVVEMVRATEYGATSTA